jgi:hypothetical protein
VSDIVERLRSVRRAMEQGRPLFADRIEMDTQEAADEIERLRGLLRECGNVIHAENGEYKWRELLGRMNAALTRQATTAQPSGSGHD